MKKNIITVKEEGRGARVKIKEDRPHYIISPLSLYSISFRLPRIIINFCFLLTIFFFASHSFLYGYVRDFFWLNYLS